MKRDDAGDTGGGGDGEEEGWVEGRGGATEVAHGRVGFVEWNGKASEEATS